MADSTAARAAQLQRERLNVLWRVTEPEPQTPEGEALTDVILATFRLHGRLMEAAQEMAAVGGLTAAWWQVIGGVLDEPRSVADVARRMARGYSGSPTCSSTTASRSIGPTRRTGAPSSSRARRPGTTPCERSPWRSIRGLPGWAQPWGFGSCAQRWARCSA